MASNADMQRAELAGSRASQSREDYAACLQHYGLSADPFDESYSPGLFFPGAERKQAVDSLQHFSRYATTPIFLTGRIGVGKTAVLNEFIRLKEPDIELVLVAAELMMTPERMLLAIATSFGLEVDGETGEELRAIYESLIERWAQLAQSDRHAIVAIDNVQDLSAEVLEALFEVFLTASGNVKLVLVGESQAARMVDTAAEKAATLINRIELAPFSQQDVADYLHYRMRAQGFEGELPLSAMQVQALTYRSRGNLVHMHQIASGMLQAAKRGGKSTARRFPLIHLLVLLLLLVSIAYLWRTGAVTPGEPHQQPIKLQGALDRSDVPEPAVADGDSGRKTMAEVQAALEQASDQPDEVIERSESEEASAERDGQEIAIVDTEQSAAAVLAASSTAIATPEPEPAPETESGQVAPALPEPDAGLPAAEEPSAIAPVAETSPGANEATAPESVVSAHRRLLAWSDVGYALQIFGTHNPRRAKELIDEYFGQADLLFYETKHNGQPWYVVINGPYSGRDAARASIESLPEDLKRLRPWPRNVASIQADIRRYQAAIDAESASGTP